MFEIKLSANVMAVLRESDRRFATRSLLVVGVIGIVLALLFPDGHQQDAGHHFLYARFAADHPASFVSVWNRPLFTLLYFLPAQGGYLVAKLFTLVIALATAWQTFRLAQDLSLWRAGFMVPLTFLQPCFLLLSTETMTEPLFALVLTIALRLHHAGRVRLGMFVASLLILARPEGFVIGVLWGAWVLIDRRDPRPWWRRIPSTLLLASGFALWWLAAWAITGDLLFIPHDWPREWAVSEATYGVGPASTYFKQMPEIAGLALAPFFACGVLRALFSSELRSLTSVFLVVFLVHTVLRASGSLGSAGYSRYFVCVAPAIAILTGYGFESITRPSYVMALFAISALAALYHLDHANFEGRDFRGIGELKARFDAQPRPVTRLIWSQAYMAILFDRDPAETPDFRGDHAANLEELRRSPSGTLVFWDTDRGPTVHRLVPSDFVDAGYTLLDSKRFSLKGWWRPDLWLRRARIREQEFFLFYKP